MKLSIIIAMTIASLGSTLADDQFPNGSTLKPENLICKKDGNFKCLSEHVKDIGKLENVPIDGISYEFKKSPNLEYDSELYINGELYLEFNNQGRSIDELTKMMAEKIESTKSKGKETIVIPRITENGHFFVGSPTFRFVLPVFDGPSEEDIKEYEIEKKYKSEIRKLRKELSESKANESDLESKLELIEGQLYSLKKDLKNAKAEKLDCENKLTQSDKAPIDLNRNPLNDLNLGLDRDQDNQNVGPNVGEQR